MSKRFKFEDNNIIDEWTEYVYKYSNPNDWKELCGLLNQLHLIALNCTNDKK